jgi:hypothetical protein
MSLTKLPLGRNNSVMTSLFPPRESLVVTSRLGTGNLRTFFYGVVSSLGNWENATHMPAGYSDILHDVLPLNEIFYALSPSYLFILSPLYNRAGNRTRGCYHTTTTLQRHNTRKFEANIPRKGTARLQSQFLHSCFCVSDLHIPLVGLPILLQENRWAERGNICIYIQ